MREAPERAPLASDQPALVGPACELVPRGELQLPQDARNVRLDRLDAQVQARGDLLVPVAAGDQLKYLALARSERLELRVGAHRLACAESVQDEAGQPG